MTYLPDLTIYEKIGYISSEEITRLLVAKNWSCDLNLCFRAWRSVPDSGFICWNFGTNTGNLMTRRVMIELWWKKLTSLLPPSLDPQSLSSNISTESQFYWLTIKFSDVLCWFNITSGRNGKSFITIRGIFMENWEAGQMLIFALRGRSIIVHIDNFLPCGKPLRIFYHATSWQSVAFPFTQRTNIIRYSRLRDRHSFQN